MKLPTWKPAETLCAQLRRKQGFAMMEIILLLVLIGIIGTNVIFIQNSTWKRTGSSNRMLIAGQMIERQVESMRKWVDMDPESNFPPTDSSFTENGITMRWVISPATRLRGAAADLPNVRRCDIIAGWGTVKGDSLCVTTYIARNF